MKLYWYWLICAGIVLAGGSPVWAQANAVPHDVVGSGGGASSDGTHYIYCTVGQSATGVITGAANNKKIGYLYVVDRLHIGPTSEVTITAFTAVYKDFGVDLDWAIGSANDIQGYNIYRAPANGGGFERVNDELIPAGVTCTFRDEGVRPSREYLYQVGAVDLDGEYRSSIVSVAIPAAKTTLDQNYPNPFNPSTTISFVLAARERVELVIYDVNGGRVRDLLDEKLDFGKHEVTWDGRDNAGTPVGSGIYFYRFKAGNRVMTKKLTLLK